MSKCTEAVILCEDRQQELFARYFLIECGINKRRIRVKIAKKGVGSGEQFVRENYPSEVKAFRSRNYLNISLVIFVDADVNTVNYRLKQLDKELVSALLNRNRRNRRQTNEKIAIFVPKRNIETWIRYLKGNKVNEEAIYSKLPKESACKTFVKRLAHNYNEPLPEDAPHSLKKACIELARIIYPK